MRPPTSKTKQSSGAKETVKTGTAAMWQEELLFPPQDTTHSTEKSYSGAWGKPGSWEQKTKTKIKTKHQNPSLELKSQANSGSSTQILTLLKRELKSPKRGVLESP